METTFATCGHDILLDVPKLNIRCLNDWCELQWWFSGGFMELLYPKALLGHKFIANPAVNSVTVNPHPVYFSVLGGNYASLPVSRTGAFPPTASLILPHVLIVLGLTRNLISISKHTSDFSFSITFINDRFVVYNWVTKGMVVTWKWAIYMFFSVDFNL